MKKLIALLALLGLATAAVAIPAHAQAEAPNNHMGDKAHEMGEMNHEVNHQEAQNQERPDHMNENTPEQAEQGPPEDVTRGPPAFVYDLVPEHVLDRAFAFSR